MTLPDSTGASTPPGASSGQPTKPRDQYQKPAYHCGSPGSPYTLGDSPGASWDFKRVGPTSKWHARLSLVAAKRRARTPCGRAVHCAFSFPRSESAGSRLLSLLLPSYEARELMLVLSCTPCSNCACSFLSLIDSRIIIRERVRHQPGVPLVHDTLHIAVFYHINALTPTSTA
jgi:hypothetical protein